MKTPPMIAFVSFQTCTALPARGSHGGSRRVLPASVQWARLALYSLWHRAVLLASRLLLLCFLALVMFGWSQQVMAGGQVVGPGAAVVLAQGMPSLQPVVDFISEVMLVVGGIVIFVGAVRISRGEIFEGTVAILAGALIVMAFPIIRAFFMK